MRRLLGRRTATRSAGTVDALIVGLGNPGSRYAGTRHNAGFQAAELLIARWGLPRPANKFGGLISDGRAGPGGPRVALLLPQTYMNESGTAAGPARGSFRLALDRVIVLHDEIDLPFGEVRVKLGGGVAGHNGLKSLDRGLGSRDFWRVRIGIGRPEGTDPEIVSRYVLGRFSEGREEVEALLDRAAAATERLLEEITAPASEGAQQEEPAGG